MNATSLIVLCSRAIYVFCVFLLLYTQVTHLLTSYLLSSNLFFFHWKSKENSDVGMEEVDW